MGIFGLASKIFTKKGAATTVKSAGLGSIAAGSYMLGSRSSGESEDESSSQSNQSDFSSSTDGDSSAAAGGGSRSDQPSLDSPKQVTAVQKPTLSTISEQFSQLIEISTNIANLLEEQQTATLKQLDLEEDLSKELALESNVGIDNKVMKSSVLGGDITGDFNESLTALNKSIEVLINTLPNITALNTNNIPGFISEIAEGAAEGAAAGAVGSAITGTAAIAGTAAVAGTGSIIYGIDQFMKSTNIDARKKQEEGTAKFGLTGNNMEGFSINGNPAGKYNDLPEYYKNVSNGYGGDIRGGSAERSRKYVQTHNPDGSLKTKKDQEQPEVKPNIAAVPGQQVTLMSTEPLMGVRSPDAPTGIAPSSPKITPTADVSSSSETSFTGKISGDTTEQQSAFRQMMDDPKMAPTADISPVPIAPDIGARLTSESLSNEMMYNSNDVSVINIGGTSTPAMTPASMPSTRFGTMGMGDVPDPTYYGAGDISSQLYS